MWIAVCLGLAQASPSWVPTGSLSAPNRSHVAALLPDGRVLVVGGLLATAEVYDPGVGAFSPAASPLADHGQGLTATSLDDGRVLVVGGSRALRSAEVYDPGTETWHVTAGPPVFAHKFHTATALLDGRVLLAGGEGEDDLSSRLAEVFDPTTGTFATTGALVADRRVAGAVRLDDGTVLVVGGSHSTSDRIGVSLASAELYDPATGTFAETGSMTVARLESHATLLADGSVLVTGSDTADRYEPGTGAFVPIGPPVGGRDAVFASVALPDGTVLLCGGAVEVGPVVTETAERFDPATGQFAFTASMHQRRQEHTVTLLRDGSVLVTGGYLGAEETSTAERYFLTCEDPTDTDVDGHPDCADVCPAVADPDQGDLDGDGIGDVCDDCPDCTTPGDTGLEGTPAAIPRKATTGTPDASASGCRTAEGGPWATLLGALALRRRKAPCLPRPQRRRGP